MVGRGTEHGDALAQGRAQQRLRLGLAQVVGHPLVVGVEHRVEDEPRQTGGRRGVRHATCDADLVGVHVGGEVVGRPRAVERGIQPSPRDEVEGDRHRTGGAAPSRPWRTPPARPPRAASSADVTARPVLPAAPTTRTGPVVVVGAHGIRQPTSNRRPARQTKSTSASVAPPERVGVARAAVEERLGARSRAAAQLRPQRVGGRVVEHRSSAVAGRARRRSRARAPSTRDLAPGDVAHAPRRTAARAGHPSHHRRSSGSGSTCRPARARRRPARRHRARRAARGRRSPRTGGRPCRP